jgi:hypothetical protein
MRVALVVGMFGGSGCIAADSDEATGAATAAIQQANGREINGTSLNGAPFGRLQSVFSPSHSYHSVVASGGILTATNGTEMTSLLFGDMVNATVFDSGSAIQLKVYDVPAGVPISDAAGTTAYTSYDLRPSTDATASICGNTVRAIPIPGYWDAQGAFNAPSGDITFACENSAAGKCIKLGYTPWGAYPRSNLFNTCVRAIRADYLGDGTSHTVDGTVIDIFDASPWGGRINGYDTTYAAWRDEAEWDSAAGSKGAVCLSAMRQPVSGKSPCDVGPLIGVTTPSSPYIFTRIQ